MTKVIRTACAVALAGLGACGTPTNNPDTNTNTNSNNNSNNQVQTGTEARSDKLRDSTPPVTPAQVAQQAAGNRAFGFDLYQKLRAAESGNVFYSPYSVSVCLGMTWAGARHNTESQMASTLHYVLPQATLHPAMDALDLALASRSHGAGAGQGAGFTLKVANSLWGQTGYHLESNFLDVLAQDYGAGERLLDFTQSASAIDAINAWVNTETEQRIPHLLQTGDIDGSTRLVLVNAIYFKAQWAQPFDRHNTQAGTFHAAGGDVNAQFMYQGSYYPYAKGADWQAVEIPYDGNQMSMLVLVPDAGKLEDVESRLDDTFFTSVTGALTSRDVELTLPKWSSESRFKLHEMLPAMGMPDAFDPSKADFRGMNGGSEPLWIATVVHQANVSVDEDGTVAGAATATGMAGSGMPTDIVQLTVDRPFLYFVRDIPSGTIVFAGRLATPAN
jgi:serpin B